MIGGKIRNVFMFDDRLGIDVQDGKDRCAIDLPLDAALLGVKRGDSIWWQSRLALWTPKPDDGREDVEIERIGYSYGVEYLWAKVYALCKKGICPSCGKEDCMADGEGSLWCGRCGESIRAPYPDEIEMAPAPEGGMSKHE